MDISEFFQTDYIVFAGYDIARKIPSLVDGFKISQRKVFHTLNKNNINSANKEIKVEQLAAKTAEQTQYLHGTASLASTISSLGQNYSCSGKNISLLVPDGNFGSRFDPVASAPRYIYTYLSEVSNLIFKKEDLALLPQQEFENAPIEPKYYLPIIPMSLVNSSSGVAVGFASSCYSRNPLEVIEWLTNKLNDSTFNNPSSFVPYLSGFKGEIFSEQGAHVFKGKYTKINTNNIEINEIPPFYSLNQYIKILDSLVDKKIIHSYTDLSNEDKYHFHVKCPAVFLKQSPAKILSDLRLITTDKDNLTFLDENGIVQQFNSVEEFLNYWYNFRLNLYGKRKEIQLDMLKKDILIQENKHNFLNAITNKHIDPSSSLSQIETYLESNKFLKVDDSYSYLYNINIISISKDKLNSIGCTLDKDKKKMQELEHLDVKKIWLNELQELKSYLVNEKKEGK